MMIPTPNPEIASSGPIHRQALLRHQLMKHFESTGS